MIKYVMGLELVIFLELLGVVCCLFCGCVYWFVNGCWELGNVGDFWFMRWVVGVEILW